MNKNNLIFALDIGTRSIVGVVGVLENGNFKVLDHEEKFHSKRAMRDGQIEDIGLVADVVATVKSNLEERCGHQLKEVAIAAAGRSLKTSCGSFSQDLLENEEVTDKFIKFIEYSAIENAQSNFFDKQENEKGKKISGKDYYCVGYSVTDYFLDDYKMKNLLGQKGESVSVNIIAAFLPSSVLTSLYAVTSRCNLEVSNITLEPIAAIHAVVPDDTRFLNLALVDIGGGTSDIAISKDGSIFGYDMVTIAGDEITERIMKEYLTSFNVSEKIKLSLKNEELITFTDILGFDYTISCEDCYNKIKDSITKLASEISNSILELNTNSPTAVFLVGGGSQIPGLTNMIANNLNLPENRVALGVVSKENNIDISNEALLNPLFVTPIGIGIISSLYKGCEFFSVTVNGHKLMLFNNQDMKVLDALMLSGIKPSSLVGISSSSLVYYLNNEEQIVKGDFGKPGSILLNDKPATIETFLKQGDELIVEKAVKGNSPIISLQDVVDKFSSKYPTVDIHEVWVNGNLLDPDDVDFDSWLISYKSDIIIKTEPDYISVELANSTEYNDYESSIPSDFDNQDNSTTENSTVNEISRDENSIKVTINGQLVSLSQTTDEPLIMMHLLKFIELGEPPNSTSKFIIKLNGNDSKYAELIHDGDIAEIRWE